MRTLKEWRNDAEGPAYFNMSKTMIRYALEDLDAWLESCRRRNSEDSLRRDAFVRELFQMTDWPDYRELDGFAFQELCERHGLLKRELRTVPCGTFCACADYADTGDQVTCYRRTGSGYG